MYQSILPSLVLENNRIDSGSLIEVPIHCRKISGKCAQYYKNIMGTNGIYKCPCGYSAAVLNGRIYTCLKISKYYTKNSIRKYEEQLNNPVLTQTQVENIIHFELKNQNIIDESKTFLAKTKLILHDARQLNTEIQYKSENLSENLSKLSKEIKKKPSCVEALDDAHKIWHSSNMIYNTYSMIDTFLNPASAGYGLRNKCNIFNKFFKIRNIMEYKAKEKNIEIVMHNHIEKPNIEAYSSFDQVPFIIIDNAIKYAEINSKIDISFEKKGANICVRTESKGPLVYEDELSKIFENEYRGKNAILITPQGSGIGLYLAKIICNNNGLKIYAKTEPLMHQGKISNKGYFTIFIEALHHCD